MTAFLPSVVAEAARRFGDAPALTADGDWALSYLDLDRRSDEAAVGLARRGVSAEDVVCLALPSSPEYVVAYVALAKLGARTAGLNPSLALPERRRLVELVDPRLVLGTPDQVDGLVDDAEVVDPANTPDAVLRSLRVDGAEPGPIPTDPDRIVCLVFTSGTTGTPKAAVFTDRHLESISRLEAGDAWGGGGASISATQLAHVGAMTKLPWMLRRGGTQHLLRRWRAADVLDLVERERIAALGAVAPQLALILADPDLAGRDLRELRTVIAGGAASPPDLVRRSRDRLGVDYVVRYSSTESGGIGTGTAPGADDDEVLHTVGRPRPGVEVDVRDGEVWLRSPAVMAAYWNDPATTAEVLVDGWLRTGDLGEMDDEGRLRLRGRSKEMYIRGGYNVFPAEVEVVLTSHPAVAELAVVPRPDPVMGEVGVAVVVVHPGEDAPSLDELRAFGRDHLAAWKLPEGIRVVDELPRTAMLKLDRLTLTDHEAAAGG